MIGRKSARNQRNNLRAAPPPSLAFGRQRSRRKAACVPLRRDQLGDVDPDEVHVLPASPEPDELLDLHCERCGSSNIENVVPLRPAEPFNLCHGCGSRDEYVPTRQTIAAECEAIRRSPIAEWGIEVGGDPTSRAAAKRHEDAQRCELCGSLNFGPCVPCEREMARKAGRVLSPQLGYRREMSGVLGRPIATLPLSARTINSLEHCGLLFVGELAATSPAEVRRRCANVADKALDAIRRALASVGVEWDEPDNLAASPPATMRASDSR